MKKDRMCEFMNCIRNTTKTCDKCLCWLCDEHLPKEKHDCETTKEWQDFSGELNQMERGLEPFDILPPDDSRDFSGETQKKDWREDWK